MWNDEKLLVRNEQTTSQDDHRCLSILNTPIFLMHRLNHRNSSKKFIDIITIKFHCFHTSFAAVVVVAAAAAALCFHFESVNLALNHVCGSNAWQRLRMVILEYCCCWCFSSEINIWPLLNSKKTTNTWYRSRYNKFDDFVCLLPSLTLTIPSDSIRIAVA